MSDIGNELTTPKVGDDDQPKIKLHEGRFEELMYKRHQNATIDLEQERKLYQNLDNEDDCESDDAYKSDLAYELNLNKQNTARAPTERPKSFNPNLKKGFLANA